MNQQMNKDCCYLCDTYLTSIPNKVQIEHENNELERISTVKKYLPTINKWQFDLICESCLNYILDFDEVRRKWENNESIFKQKTQDRSKSLRDISNSKNKKCTYICRLCLKAITTQEVTFVYHDNEVYESSYVHNVLSLHSPQTDLSLTENPVICNECLDEVQTFDAFHQMWMEVQAGQEQSSGCRVNSCDNVEPRKFDENRETRTGSNLMEEESIGSILCNDENVPRESLALTNGISAGISSNDIFLISDDEEEIENQINNSAKIGVDTSTEAESAVRGLLNDQDSVCGTPEEFHNKVFTVSDDEDMIESSIDINQHSRGMGGECDLAQIIPLKENIRPDKSNDDFRQINLSKSESLSRENESVVLFSSGHVENNLDINNDGFSLEENVSESSGPVQTNFAFVEIDDSDSQDSEDCEEISMPLIPKISNVCSVDENDIPTNETKIFEDNNSLQPFSSNTDFSNESSVEITTSIELNMTKVKELFQTSPGDDTIVILDDENEFEISQDVPSLEIDMSKVKEFFQDVDNRESNLEENLSDFLKFNKPINSKRRIDESNELVDFEQQIELNARVKKFKVDANSTSPPKNENTFSLAFRDFVETIEKIPEQSSSNSKNSAETLDVISSKDMFECYCKWYPYKQRFSNRSKSRKKIKATVMENSLGSQIYQCNKCLFAVDKEYELVNHLCVKNHAKDRFWCRKRKCRFSSFEEKSFVLHNLFHNIEELGWLKCTICEFRALDDHLMAEHHKQSHQMGIVQRHSKCPNCYFEADEPQILSHHIRTRHRLHKNTTPYEANKKL